MKLSHTDNIEVAYLKTLAKDNIMQFYKASFSFSFVSNVQISSGLVESSLL